MRLVPNSVVLAACLLLVGSCGARNSDTEGTVPQPTPAMSEPELDPAPASDHTTPLGSLLVLKEGTASTPQLMSLAGGGFTVARRAGVSMGLELELQNVAAVPINYWGFHDATYPIFQVEELIDHQWQEIPMGYCGSETGLQRFSIEAGGKQRMLIPLPEGSSPLRIVVEVTSSVDAEHSNEVAAEWRS